MSIYPHLAKQSTCVIKEVKWVNNIGLWETLRLKEIVDLFHFMNLKHESMALTLINFMSSIMAHFHTE